MTKNSTITALEHSTLTVVRKEKKKNAIVKLVNLKQITYKKQVLLPPQEEKYIKAKNHDFF